MFKMDIVSGNEQTYHIDNANITHMWTFKILLIHYVNEKKILGKIA